MNGPVRLSAPAGAAAPAHRRVCLDCGQPFGAHARHGEFCSTACRNAWNNRRLSRGADLYDLFMASRFDRATAKALKVWRLLNRMAARFREEDRAERQGRPSWRPPGQVIARHPELLAERLTPGRRP